MAQSVTTAPTVSISAQSRFKPVTGDVYVYYAAGKYSDVTIKGDISGATTGDVAVLYAQQWPYKKKPVQVPREHVGLVVTGSSAVSYSFTASPGLATRYSVEVLASLSSTTELGGSKVVNVYVLANESASAFQKCARPTCHETWHLYEVVPPSTYKAESGKRMYFYFGLDLSTTGEPGPPRWLYLDHSASISKVRRISRSKFERTITWSFRIGNDGYYWWPAACTKDSESRDGLNLPGSHSCGNRRIPRTIAYLG
jgi:hypothetical protein